MKLSRTMLKLAILSASVLALAACNSVQSVTPNQINACKPVAPQLEWYDVEVGIYYPERSVDNLMLYIEQLNDCIDYHNINPG
ncbi:hypothetical protein [Vibrio aestuarianus]|uniref:Uncharacterized protein n=1 Tax=Vibrio aestuarianus TaxID=28171 RepID=A0ABD7YQR5_9VIBR|nr:hypothetical protein [Vibrio aestuarianus]WGK87243.1 hypothetical protein PYE67_14055 [Vibrio aestuarianus]CAH8235288.1 conserved exported hypothetical protein [Vibrio aestuarianus]